MAAERPEAPWVKVRVRIDGDELTIRGRGPESYVIELANRVNSRIQEVRRNHPNLARHHGPSWPPCTRGTKRTSSARKTTSSRSSWRTSGEPH